MIMLFCWLFLNYLLLENWKSGINGERGVVNNILDKLRERATDLPLHFLRVARKWFA